MTKILPDRGNQTVAAVPHRISDLVNIALGDVRVGHGYCGVFGGEVSNGITKALDDGRKMCVVECGEVIPRLLKIEDVLERVGRSVYGRLAEA